MPFVYGKGKLKKNYNLLIGLGILFLVFLIFPFSAFAQIKGVCDNCHVWHAGENPLLLVKPSCLGCHGQNPGGKDNIVMIGVDRIPQVMHSMPDGDLAGGNFRYTLPEFGGDGQHGHNIKGLSVVENGPGNPPPGFVGNVPIPGGMGPAVWEKGRKLECAGTWGCHGDRTKKDPMQAIMGAHHGNDGIVDGSSVGRSYRFLNGVRGVEHDDWEHLANSVNHNGYKGDVTFEATDTIGYLCGECHAQFHPNKYLGGPDALGYWHRHPTEISYDSTDKGSKYVRNYNVYDLSVPVARIEPSGIANLVDGQNIVTCITCHRPHSSPYSFGLRWDYSKIMTGDPNAPRVGCLVCHWDK